MAKKAISKLRKEGGKGFTHCIKMVKSDKSGSYAFKEEVIANANVQNFFSN